MADEHIYEEALIQIAFYQRDPADYRRIARKALAEGTTTAEMAERIKKFLPTPSEYECDG